MAALVQRLDAKQMRGWSCGSGGAFALPVNCWCVVVPVMCCFFSNICAVGYNVMVGNGTGKFEVAVGHGAIGIVA